MVEEFPELQAISSEKYAFFVTNASVAIALRGIEAKRSEETYQRALEAAEDRLRHYWEEDGARAVVDCNEFVERAFSGPREIEESQYTDALKYATGKWIVWNMFEEQPRDDQRRLESVLGGYAVEVSRVYWE